MSIGLFQHQVQQSSESFTSGGVQIKIDSFVPITHGSFPAVIALHGSGGMREGFASEPARLLASNGFAVFLLHYFERTGTVWADRITVRKDFPTWIATIQDAISHVAQKPGVDEEQIGVLGFSLGGYLAVSVAVVDARVKAVVEFFGGLPEELAGELHRIPPVLIFHGDADRVVLVSEAHRLEKVLKAAGSPYEIKIYSGVGHGFSGLTLFDAAQRTVTFLRNHLQREQQVEEAAG